MAADRIALSMIVGLTVLALPRLAEAQGDANYDQLYEKYLIAARHVPAGEAVWMADLMSDRSARRVNDLVTVRVLESLSATGSADSGVNKKSSATVVLPTPASKGIAKALPAAADTKFTGAGATTRTTELSAALTARVTEVLPNGDLVIEGVREIDINGDRSVVVLTGVIRAADIQPGNVILSTNIGQLRIRSLSEGLIHDSLQPGWLIKALNKIF